ncbi:MAG: hypothetical protein IPL88_12270 [Rhizobiales bacterium]|nr:hypothetical protein [Hyphomicrobiales bacterium]
MGADTHSDGTARAGARGAAVEIALFGEPRVSANGARLQLPDRALAVVALLSTHAGGAMRRADARRLVFAEADPERAAANFRQTLARLRKLQVETGATLMEEEGETLRLVSGCANDVAAFLSAPQASRDPAQDARERLGLYRGEFLAGFDSLNPEFDEWLAEQREALRALFVETAAAAVAADDLLSERERVDLARRVLLLDPARESVARALMRLLAARGDAAGAQAVYDTVKTRLARDYGARPEAATRAALEHILARPDAAAPPSPEPDAERRVGAPRVLILPPVAISHDAVDSGLFAAFLEDVTVGLARYRSFVVLAPHTARVAALAADRDEAIQRVGADFHVSTALKPALGGAAVSVRLTAANGQVLWVTDIDWRADQMTRAFAEIVRHVVASLVDAIERTTLRAPAAAPDATAYRLVLEGRRCLVTVDLPNLRRARKWFRQAIARADGYAAAYADLARTLVLEYLVLGLADGEGLDDAASLADRATHLDPADWAGLRSRALADLYARRHDPSLERFARAAALAPNDADLRADYADALAFSGDPEGGLAMIGEAMRLNPLHPGYYDWIRGSILFQMRQYREARAALDPVKTNPAVARLLAATCARAGDRAAAGRFARALRENYPGFRADDVWRLSPNRRADDTRHLVEALKEAGVD